MNIPKPELIDITKLIVDKENPNVMSQNNQTALMNVIKKYGFLVPIITNKEYKIADGYHRKIAAQSLGYTQVPVIALDVKDVDRRILRQVMNKLRGDHKEDLDTLEYEAIFKEDKISELIKLIPDYTKEINKAVDSLELSGQPEEDFDEQTAFDKAKETDIKPGDVFDLGNHRLMCGDSTKEGDTRILMGGQKATLMVTDPPYGVNYDTKWRDEADKKGLLGNRYPTRALADVRNDDRIDWSEAYKLFNGNVAYIWHAGKFTKQAQESLEACGFEIINQIIWVKPHFILSRGDYHWKHEPCLYAVRKGEKHEYVGDRSQTTVWEIAGMNCFGGSKKAEDKMTGHGTQKPLDCMAIPIKNNSVENDGVYDPFGGSGTTLIACEKLKRKCFMMEIDPTYCQVIIDRWQNYTKKIGVMHSG